MGLNILASCANRIPPTGGEKDTAPPLLLYAYPKNKTENFKKREIILVFDEIIQERNIRKNILITPEIANERIRFKTAGRRLHIRFKEPLLKGTTYTFDLEGCLADVTENNTIGSVRYVLSTGSYIDSLRVKGKVLYGLDKKPGKDISVALLRASDTASITGRRFSYYTRSDSLGNFIIEHLKRGLYKVFAFQDENRNRQMDVSSEEHGFLKEPIHLEKEAAENILIEIYQADARALKKTRDQAYKGYYDVLYNKEVHTYHAYVAGNTLPKSLYHHREGAKIRFYGAQLTEEEREKLKSKEVMLSVRDIIGNCVEDLLTLDLQESNEKDTFEFSIAENQLLKKEGEITFTFSFNKPVERVLMEAITCSEKPDEETKEGISEILNMLREKWNQHRTEWQVTYGKEELSSEEKVSRSYVLVVEKGSFRSVEEEESDRKEVPYTEKVRSEYGSISGQVKNVRTNTKYIIELVDQKGKVKRRVYRGSFFSFRSVAPGNYLVRVIEDRNNDKVWNPGNVRVGILPENVTASKDIPLRKNWNINNIIITF